MIRNFLSLGLAAAGALALTGLTAGTVHAATVNTNANVIFIVDESGSMAGEQAFLKDTVVDALDSGLAAEGVTNRSYGVVGFGGIPAEPRDAGSGLMNTTDTKTAIDSLATSGGF
ncbi:hypothetical protein ACROSR_03290 [Roseovarius tibetensis]|uniref:hypothetical protein n=1 Tax=Roseovarius tibetensis TaxID=2685897 RepID=UPI003D8001B8